jgi:hypothetical protein
MFGRKSKKPGGNPSSDHAVEGIVHRGLAEASGRLPSERVRRRTPPEGSNPYDTIGKSAKRTPRAAPKKKSPSESTGAHNPYNSAQEQPGKKKKSWDDVHFDISD